MFPACVILFVFGAIFGTLGDFSHVLTEVDGYLNPIAPLPGTYQPFWVPLLFGSATLSIGLTHYWADSWIGPKDRVVSEDIKTHILANLAFLLIYIASGALNFLDTGGSRDIVLASAAILVWFSFDRTWQGLFEGTITAILGVLVEVILTRSGAFFYFPSAANFLGVPSWLPWLYLAASVSVGNAARFLFRMGGRKLQDFHVAA